MKKTFRKITALVLCLIMLIGIVPMTDDLLPGSIEASAADEILSNDAPSGYDENDESNPYGLDVSATGGTKITKDHELLMYYSADSSSSEDKKNNGLYFAKDPSVFVGNAKDDNGNYYQCTLLSESLMNSSSTTKLKSGVYGPDNINGTSFKSESFYTKSVACDLTGSGYDNCVATIYCARDSDGDHCYVFFRLEKVTSSGITKIKESTLGSVDWTKLDIAQAKMTNYFDITAGDYDGDGKDEFATFASFDINDETHGTDYESYVYIFDSTGELGGSIPLKTTTNDPNNSSEKEKVTCSLASGDINNDGNEELIINMGTNKSCSEYTYDSKNSYNYRHVCNLTAYTFTKSTTSFSGKTYTSFSSNKIVDVMTSSYESTDKIYNAIQSADCAVGDVDGDGELEIVVAGYLSKLTVNTSTCKVSNLYSFDKTVFGMYTLKYKKTSSIYAPYETAPVVEEIQMTDLQKYGLNDFGYDNSKEVHPMMNVQCVAVNGPGAPELVCVNGSFYSLTADSPVDVYDVLNYSTLSSASSNFHYSTLYYVEQAAVGSFSGDNTGMEQIYFTVCYKSGNSTYYKLVAMGKKGDAYYTVCGNLSGNLQNKDSLDIKGSTKSSPGTNLVLTAVDYDNDGLKLSYVGRGYTYSDPEVIAVLQAAPYFEELQEYDDFSGGTSYSVTTEYSKTKTSSDNVSFGVGVSLSADAKFAEASKEYGYALEWTKEYEESWSTSNTYTFSAGATNTVAIRRTPVYIYAYKQWDYTTNDWYRDSNGNYEAMYLSVPQNPVFYQLSVEEYNDFCDTYAALCKSNGSTSSLKKITDDVLPLDCEGNPHNYYHSKFEGWQDLSGGNYYALSYTGGSMVNQYSAGSSTSVGTSTSHGFHFSESALFGLEEAKIGFYVELDYNHSKGSYTSTTDEKSYEGSVSGIIHGGGLTKEMANSYKFNWTFGMWSYQLQSSIVDNKETFEKIPVLGYITNGCAAPPLPVNDLQADVSDKVVTLTWSDTSVSKENSWRNLCRGFNVYIEKFGEWEKINDAMIKADGSNKKYSYTYTAADDEILVSFAVCIIDDSTGKVGVYSNTASTVVIPDKKVTNVSVVNSDSGSKQLNICYDNGSTDNVELTTGLSSYEIAKNELNYQGTAENWNNLVKQKGSAYEALKSIGYTGTETDFAKENNCKETHSYVEYRLDSKCESAGFVIKICSACGDVQFSFVAPTSHDYVAQVIEPDCTQRGYTVYTCSKCGDQYTKDYTAALGHNYSKQVVEPTCTDMGYTVYTCTRCGEKHIDDVVPALGHNYSKQVVEPTCTDMGYTKYTCETCGESYVDDIVPATEHDYEAVVTAPTCTEKGYTTYTCKNCGDQYVSDIKETVKHNFATKVIESTCVSGGYTIKYCADCGYQEIINETAAKSHNYEVTSVTAATCMSKGYSTYTCKDCGVSYIGDETEPVEHNYEDKVVVPDCNHEGYTIHTCTACGTSKVDTYTDKTEHTPGEWFCDDYAVGHYIKRCEKCYCKLDEKTVSVSIGGNDGETTISQGEAVNVSYGETIDLNIDSESTNFKYVSSDPDVAVINENGEIEAVGAGTAVIIITDEDTGITTSFSVKIAKPWWQKVHDVLSNIIFFKILFMIFGIRY